jgi:transposase-like protein
MPFGSAIASTSATVILKRKHSGYSDTFFIDEVFVKINGKQHYRDLRISALAG